MYNITAEMEGFTGRVAFNAIRYNHASAFLSWTRVPPSVSATMATIERRFAMSDTTFIYGLVDPRDDMLRYIGKSDNLTKRLTDHMCVYEKEHNHKAHWLKSLKREGLKPEIFEIERVSKSDWQDAEQFWIKYFKFIGANLTNGNEGGVGGVSPSLSVRDARRAKMTGKKRSQEFKDKISMAKTGKPNYKLRGRKVDPEHLRRMVELAKSPGSRAKQSVSAKRRANSPENVFRMKTNNPASRPEVRAKISAAAKRRRINKDQIEIPGFEK